MPIVSINDTTSVEVEEGEILYDALNSRGIQLPHGCLAGSCGACRVNILKGQDHLAPASFVEQNTIESLIEEFRTTKGMDFIKRANIRLSCRARVLGDITICPIK